MQYLATDIVRRTKGGLDSNRQPFIPYTSNYVKKKKKTRVNLYDTGQMLNSFKPIGNDTIGFDNVKAANKYGYNRSMGRQMVGLDSKQDKYIEDYVHKAIKKDIDKWSKRLS